MTLLKEALCLNKKFFTQDYLNQVFPLLKKNQIITDEAALKINSIDASFYSLTPKAIIDVESEEQMQ